MSKDLPDLDDLEIVQMMAAQRVVMDNHEQLHREYLNQIHNQCKKYGVDIPENVKQELPE